MLFCHLVSWMEWSYVILPDFNVPFIEAECVLCFRRMTPSIWSSRDGSIIIIRASGRGEGLFSFVHFMFSSISSIFNIVNVQHLLIYPMTHHCWFITHFSKRCITADDSSKYCISTDDSSLLIRDIPLWFGKVYQFIPWHNRRGHNFCFSKSQECHWQDWYIFIEDATKL